MSRPHRTATWWQWTIGILGSWTIVWFTGPLALDSILVRVTDPELGINTLRPGDVIRWRSEGWGNTRIGPHGLPGWQPRNVSQRIVIWGDSQVEGVCVDDPEKIGNQVIDIAQAQWQLELDCLPMGRSGADARDWRDLIDEADALWHPRLHIWVVTELSDLTSLAPLGEVEPYRRWTMSSPGWVKWAAALRAEALFAAGKRILRDPQTGGLRRLNFALGPRPAQTPGGSPETEHVESGVAAQAQAIAVAAEVDQLAQRLGGRLAILYAPATPTLAQPLAREHPDDALFERIAEALFLAGIEVVDVRADFIALWDKETRLPRGFHNGLPGYGHLNADGNRLIAQAIVALVQERLSR